jgi:hypothetical protein
MDNKAVDGPNRIECATVFNSAELTTATLSRINKISLKEGIINNSLCSFKLADGTMAPCAYSGQLSLASSEMKKKLESLKDTSCPTDVESSMSTQMNHCPCKKRNTSKFFTTELKEVELNQVQTLLRQTISGCPRDQESDMTSEFINQPPKINKIAKGIYDPTSRSACSKSSSCSGLEIMLSDSDSCSPLEHDVNGSVSSLDGQSLGSAQGSGGKINIRLQEPQFSDDSSCKFSFELCYEKEKAEGLVGIPAPCLAEPTDWSIIARSDSMKSSKWSMLTDYGERCCSTSTIRNGSLCTISRYAARKNTVCKADNRSINLVECAYLTSKTVDFHKSADRRKSPKLRAGGFIRLRSNTYNNL